jgi:hypothetical protein
MSDSINPLSMMATAPMSTGKSKSGSWYEAMADAWGQTLDKQAGDIEALADQVSAGDDKPATITQLSAASLKMGYLSSSSHTALSSTGEALKTMAQKS